MSRLTIFASILLFSLLFFLYTITVPNLNPNLADSDELITAAKVFGVPHPPGYPLFVMLAAVAGRLPIPNFTFAGKINLLSAFCQVLSIEFFFLTALIFLKQIFKDKKSVLLGAFFASLALGLSFQYWFYGIFAEVFPLSDLLASMFVFVLFLWKDNFGKKTKLNNRLLFIVALLFGLGVSNQQAIVLLAPFVLLWVISVDRNIFKRWKELIALAGLFLAGFLLPYIYVFIAASHNPFLNWENVNNPYSLFRLIFRRIYADTSWQKSAYFSFGQIKPLETFYQLSQYLSYLKNSFAGWLFALGIIGAIYLFLQKKGQLLLLISLGFFFTGAFFALYDPIEWSTQGYDDFTLALVIMRRFYTFSAFFFSLFIGVGITCILNYLSPIKKIFLISCLAFCFIIVSLGFESLLEVSSNPFYLSEAYIKKTFSIYKPNAVVLCFTPERGCFSSYYLQNVENLRKDLTLVSADFNQRRPEQLFAQIPNIYQTVSLSQIIRIRDIIRLQIDKRPIYIIALNSRDPLRSVLNIDGNPFYMIPRGCGVYEVSTEFVPSLEQNPCLGLEEDILYSSQSDNNYYRKMYADFFAYQHYFNGVIYGSRGCSDRARAELTQSVDLFLSYQQARDRLGGLSASGSSNNCPIDSSKITLDLLQQKISELEKNPNLAHNTLEGLISLRYQTTLVNPSNLSLRIELARSEVRGGYVQLAQDEYRDILVIDPNNKQAQKELSIIENNIK